MTCPIRRCVIGCATPGELAAHLNMEHGWPMSKALDEARQQFGVAIPEATVDAEQRAAP